MAIRASHATTRSARYALSSGPDLPLARVVVLLLLVVAVGSLLLVSKLAGSGPSPAALQVANFNPQKMLSDTTPHFLPQPVAAIPPETNAGPQPPAASEPAAQETPGEAVKVANTGRVGAILRAEPRIGRQIANLRDGSTMIVLERKELPDGEWIRVRTSEGIEGWIFGRLVGPAQ